MPGPTHPLLARALEYRFVILLVGLLVLMLAVPLAVAETGWAPQIDRSIILIALGLVVMAAAFAVCTSRRQTVTVIVLTVPTVLLVIGDVPEAGPDLAFPRNIAGVVTLGYVIILLVGYLFRQREVTFDTIAASICAYVLLAVLWAMVYTIQELAVDGSFRYANEDEGGTMHFGGTESIYALYYSFVTMTTLGFGDITPTNPSARMLTAIHAVTGQLYLAILVARLVGLHIASRPPRAADDDAGDRA